MRKAIFFIFVVVGAAVGLASALMDDWGVKAVMMTIHHRVQATGFQPVSFSSKMRYRRCCAWTTGTEVIRSFRSSITSCG